MAISTQDNNGVSVRTKVRTVRDLVVGRCITKTATNVVPTGATPNLDCSLGDDWTYTPAETNAPRATNIQPNQVLTILVSAATGNYVTTFANEFHSTGTLTTGADTSKFFMIVFKANSGGTAFYEVSRTAAQA